MGYLTAMKPRQEEDFQNMAEVAGVQNRNRGLVLTRLSAEPLPGLSLYVANYLVPDVFNTIYGNADYRRALAADLDFRIGIQYTDQRSTGDKFLGDFQTWNFGIRGDLIWRGLTMGAAFGVTGDDATLRDALWLVARLPRLHGDGLQSGGREGMGCRGQVRLRRRNPAAGAPDSRVLGVPALRRGA